MWYRGMEGCQVPLVRVEKDIFWSREPSGFLNIVHKDDAEIVEARSDG